jgi:uncharacterized protein YkwD
LLWTALAGPLVIGCATALPAADPVAALNAIRAIGCNGRPGAGKLHPDADLDRVAARLAGGDRLADAIAAEGYPAARSTSIYVARAPDDRAVAALLATRFCAEIADDAFASIGVARHVGETWLVLAAPFRPPQVSDMQAVSSRVLELVNAARSGPRKCGRRQFAATTPLALDATLGRVAEAHARDMARRGIMSHEGSDHSTAADRVARAGYPWRSVAENIASGQTGAADVVRVWLESPGHCANLMSPDMREMGVAYAFDPSSPGGTYWVQVFARR